MAMEFHRRYFGFLLVLSAMIAAAAAAQAASSVTAVLSNPEPAVGEEVQLQIKVTGAQSASVPQEISVDGLEIHQTGTSRQFEMHNFDVSSSVTYNYTIVPSRAGKFKIPAQTIRVGSDSLQTPELTLNVSGSGTNAAGAAGNSQTQTPSSKIAFAELVVAKQDVYIGEMIPAEVRLGFEPRTHARLQEGPELSGQGFTTQKLQQARETMENIGGRPYEVYTFKTAISPARAGKFEIGPVQAKAVVVLPRRPSAPRTGRPRSRFDIFDLDDPFSDPFFADAFGSLGERTEIAIKSEPVTLNVKPLPPNAPSSFSGAIGNFTMSVDAKPKNLQVGDPITVTATISGRGNFDRMTGPTIEDDHGWHKYPASSKFKQDDDVGISGEKIFETVIAPNEKKSAVPPLTFAYFDPAKGEYVTLRSDPVSIVVEGAAGPAASIAAASAPPSPSAANPAASSSPASKPADILYQLNELGSVRSFVPIYARSVFWIIQLVPLVVLLGFAGWKIRQARASDRETQQIAAREREMTQLLRELRKGDVSPQVYFSQAARVVQLKTAVAEKMNPNAVDAETAAKTFHVAEDKRTQLRALFERSDELRFSGTGNGSSKISNTEREEVLRLVESLC